MTDPRDLPCPSNHRLDVDELHTDVIEWLTACVRAAEADEDERPRGLDVMENALENWEHRIRKSVVDYMTWWVTAKRDATTHRDSIPEFATMAEQAAERVVALEDLSRRIHALKRGETLPVLNGFSEAEKVGMLDRMRRVSQLTSQNMRDRAELDDPDSREWLRSEDRDYMEERITKRRDEISHLEKQMDEIATNVAQRTEVAA